MANPTTNYGFVLPTSSDLVTDLPADFDVALQGVDTRLKALQPGTTLGDLAYSSATANTNTRLAIGSTGNVLTVAGGVPTWSAPAGGGKVLQVVQATTNTTVQSSSSAYADTTLTATITPTLSTSKILVMVSHTDNYRSGANAANAMGMRLMRGATEVYTAAREVMKSSGAGTLYVPISFNYLDSPATTSATTYKTQFASEANTAAIWVQQGGVAVSTIILLEIGA